MKRLVLSVVIAALASSASAGLSYRFDSVTTGLRESTLSGTTAVEGNNFRMNVAKGDGFTFTNNSLVLSHDGGKTIFVVDPKSKTYYQLDLAEASGSAASLFKQLGYLNFKVTEPKVAAKELGSGGTIAGYPTTRHQINSSYSMSVGSGTNAMKIGVSMATESWTTDKIPAELTNVLQKQTLTTGVPEIDKVIAASSAQAKGFPLKQVTKFSIVQNGRPIEVTTTTQIRDIAPKTFAATEFALPAGYKKVDSPIERMMKALQ